MCAMTLLDLFPLDDPHPQRNGASGEDEDTSERPTKRAKAIEWETCPLQSRRLEELNLGAPEADLECVGCVTLGDQTSGQIPVKALVELRTLIRKSIGRINIRVLAVHVAKRYARIRKRVNKDLPEGAPRLPPWSAADALQCWRYHNIDPQLQHVLRQMEYQEMIQVALSASVEKHPVTGSERINVRQAKIFIDLTKAADQLAKSMPDKKAFYSANAMIDAEETAKQGVFAYSGKPISDYFKSKKQKY